MMQYNDGVFPECYPNGKPKGYTLTLTRGDRRVIWGFTDAQVAHTEGVEAFREGFDILLEKNVGIEPDFEGEEDPQDWSWNSEELWTLTHDGEGR